jgi:hypothetical protein
MSKNKKTSSSGAMLDLWKPPRGAGDPVGCLATTYTFAPGLFDEQCLARFLEIESEPNREDLAFLLERESKLGGVYAGVLVDQTQAGVEHSLRWDVLPIRIRGGKQHAKLSLLEWSGHVRIIIASANLTDPGYRTNFEVTAAVDLTPNETNHDVLTETIAFLRSLLLLVPGALEHPPEVQRAVTFLNQVEQHMQNWKQSDRRVTLRQQLVCTLPAIDDDHPSRSSLDEAVQRCRERGRSPNKAKIATPFFDANVDTSRVTSTLCKLMAKGGQRDLVFCVPAVHDNNATTIPRLAAPIALIRTPMDYQGAVTVKMLPEIDGDKNNRPWHAKMLAFSADQYSALMIGSSNFTSAGMGVGKSHNAEANLLTVVDRVGYNREIGQLEAVWPDMQNVADPESAEWLGTQIDQEEQGKTPQLPSGFLLATYRAGEKRRIILRLDPTHLPEDWHVLACGRDTQKLLSASDWERQGRSSSVEIPWEPVQPPEKLLVYWGVNEAFLPLNVEDSRSLPPPSQLEQMSADDMLLILAATDPSAAFRMWAKRQQQSNSFDTDLDSATPIDLDPLRRYDLQATFLHRIRHRARVLAQLRSNLQRPAYSRQAVEWRLRGLVGIESLAERLVREFRKAEDKTDEALLTIADFLIVLREVEYQPDDSSLPKEEFDQVFSIFLRELVENLDQQIDINRELLSNDLMGFWKKVVKRCQE